MKSLFPRVFRHSLAALVLVPALALQFATPAHAADPNKVLKYAFKIAETSFDPATVSDLYSSYVLAAMFEPVVTYDYLARPYKLKPNTVVEMPTVTDGGRAYTFRIKPGIYF